MSGATLLADKMQRWRRDANAGAVRFDNIPIMEPAAVASEQPRRVVRRGVHAAVGHDIGRPHQHAGQDEAGATCAPGLLRDAEDALRFLDPSDFETWLNVGASLHGERWGDRAFAIWAEWTRRVRPALNSDLWATWCSFQYKTGLSASWLFAEARRRGWKPAPVMEPGVAALAQAGFDAFGYPMRTPPALAVKVSDLLHGLDVTQPLAFHMASGLAEKIAKAVEGDPALAELLPGADVLLTPDGRCVASLPAGELDASRRGDETQAPEDAFEEFRDLVHDMTASAAVPAISSRLMVSIDDPNGPPAKTGTLMLLKLHRINAAQLTAAGLDLVCAAVKAVCGANSRVGPVVFHDWAQRGGLLMSLRDAAWRYECAALPGPVSDPLGELERMAS